MDSNTGSLKDHARQPHEQNGPRYLIVADVAAVHQDGTATLAM
jgi:hypothetical protein